MRYLVTLILSILVIVAAFHFARPLPNTHFDESFLPKANYVRYIAAGNNSSVAGLFWIKALTNLGESYLTGTEFAYLGHLADLCTDLDSLFYTPYHVVGGISVVDSPDTSDFKVFRRGHRVYPEDWRLALYFALRLAKGPYPDKKAAADVMRPYFDSPDTTIPAHIRTIYRSFELDTMQTEVAIMTIVEDVMQPRYKPFLESFSSKMFNLLGADTGFDSIGEFTTAKACSHFLDELNVAGKLTKTILYNLNPCANEVLATMLGNFQDGSCPGKIQWGSGWWFLDQKDGMEKQMNALSLLGLLSRFVGMLTDSRSFLSYPRHEYFRRTMCNLLGNDIEKGLIPFTGYEEKRVRQMVEDICYNNAKNYFQF